MDNINEVLKRYYQLVLRHKKYLEEYIFDKKEGNKIYDSTKRFIEESFVWMKINNCEELENIVHSKEAMKLLEFDDYYSEKLYNLLEKYLDIDFQKLDYEEYETMLSDDNLQRILENNETSKELKWC